MKNAFVRSLGGASKVISWLEILNMSLEEPYARLAILGVELASECSKVSNDRRYVECGDALRDDSDGAGVGRGFWKR